MVRDSDEVNGIRRRRSLSGRPRGQASAGSATSRFTRGPTAAPFAARSSDVNCDHEFRFRQDLDERHACRLGGRHRSTSGLTSSTMAAASLRVPGAMTLRDGSACFRSDTHIRRLYDSAKIFSMAYDMSPEAFEAAVLDTIRHNSYKECYIRPFLYRGYHALGVEPTSVPGRSGHHGLGVGRVSWRRLTRKRRRRSGQLLGTRSSQSLSLPRQSNGELSQLAADQDGSRCQWLRRRHRARPGGFLE